MKPGGIYISSSTHQDKLIIKGQQLDGSIFRPSDWCERLATTQAHFDKSKRLQYNRYVKPGIVNGIKCLIVHHDFKTQAPESYDFLLAFAKENSLQTNLNSGLA